MTKLGHGPYQTGSLQAIEPAQVFTSSASAQQWERNTEIVLILLRLVDTQKIGIFSSTVGRVGTFVLGYGWKFLNWIRNRRNRQF